MRERADRNEVHAGLRNGADRCQGYPAAGLRLGMAEAFLHGIEGLCDHVRVPQRLSQLGVKREQIPALVKSSRGASMSGNPRDISDEELTAILEELL